MRKSKILLQNTLGIETTKPKKQFLKIHSRCRTIMKHYTGDYKKLNAFGHAAQNMQKDNYRVLSSILDTKISRDLETELKVFRINMFQCGHMYNVVYIYALDAKISSYQK